MKKILIFSSLILSSFVLSACGSMPVLKQMNKDAFGPLPETSLSISEMIIGGASFSCVKKTGMGDMKFSFYNGAARIDRFGFHDYNNNQDIIATSTELFVDDKVYAWSGDIGYVKSVEEFLKGRDFNEEIDNKVSVIMGKNFEMIEAPYQCFDEQFDKDYFMPKSGLDFQVASSSVL